MSKEPETEEKIFEAALQVFQRSGYAGTRMQTIADEAGINKSMLHYYFRSKDQLFQRVFQKSVKQFFPVIYNVLNSELDFEPKVRQLVQTYYKMFEEHPYLPSFIIHEMNQHPDRFTDFIKKSGVQIPKRFIKQIEMEVSKGNIKPVKPQEFIINTVGLCVFPVIARPMVQTVFKMDDEKYHQFLQNRKNDLPEFILNAVQT